MTLELGRHVISDFDGTLVRLSVSWSNLRRELGVERINELWQPERAAGWKTVGAAEVRAAASSPPVEEVLRALEPSSAVAILTNNSEAAVAEFLKRAPALAAKVATVVGRETLAGPKTEFEIFRKGYAQALEALGRSDAVSYVGDMSYELDFARRLGATAVDVSEFTPAGAP